ncbi:hypothetical protein CHX27_02715 [Flavobacterium aurantiibacter]|uniref:Uncharacterized protein n=1 Tax=Flavobacterium aurantiibacter TaxID=2023067 RepID=A0A256A4E6_9FLAO|nr:hypothetical protein CHX27_02715 [Flavobacterium aurantiibacter]
MRELHNKNRSTTAANSRYRRTTPFPKELSRKNHKLNFKKAFFKQGSFFLRIINLHFSDLKNREVLLASCNSSGSLGNFVGNVL